VRAGGERGERGVADAQRHADRRAVEEARQGDREAGDDQRDPPARGQHVVRQRPVGVLFGGGGFLQGMVQPLSDSMGRYGSPRPNASGPTKAIARASRSMAGAAAPNTFTRCPYFRRSVVMLSAVSRSMTVIRSGTIATTSPSRRATRFSFWNSSAIVP